MPDQWYDYKSIDGKIKGYCQGETVEDVVRFSYPYKIEDLIIKKAIWTGVELESEPENLDEIDKFMRHKPHKVRDD